MCGSSGKGLSGSSGPAAAVRLTSLAMAVWNACWSGPLHGVGLADALHSAPCRPSGPPALGMPAPGWSTAIGAEPTSAGRIVGVSLRTSDSKSPASLVPNENW